MLILAVRYSFLFWLSISESLLIPIMESDDLQIYRVSACTARCLLEQKQLNVQQEQQQLRSQQLQWENQTNLESCYHFCRKQNDKSIHLKDVRKIQENLNLKLICRDDRSLTFRIDKVGTSMMSATSQDQRRKYLPQDIYVIKVHRAKDVQEYSVYLSDDDFFTIGSLKHNTSHNITAVVVHASNEYSVIAKAQQHRTLRWGYTPGMVQDIQARSFHVDQANDMRVTAEITWKPSGDMTCCYDIICFAPESEDYDLTPLEIRDPHQLYTYNLVNLTFSSIYKIGIRAKNPNNIAKESELFWKTFEAPSCHEWYNYNFNICAPLQPVGLEVEQIILGDHEYSLNISWQQPEFFPDYYTLRVLDLTDDGKPYVLNISQIENSVVIPKIKLEGVMYEVHLTAYTPGGNSTAVTTDLTKMLVVVADKHHAVKLICFILLPIFCSGFLLLTTFIICHRRTKLKRYQERCRYFEDLEKKAPIDSKATYDFATKHLTLLHPSRLEEDLAQFQAETEEKAWLNDDVEIEKSDVTLYEVLGEGAFGVVRRGVYKDAKLGLREVAVKMLKSQPSVDDVRAFRREIEVMKSVEQHPNIVGIIGHCTKRVTEMWLLTEYCSFGNLLEFLRNEWKYLHELKFEEESNRLAADARKQQSIRVESNYKTTSKSRNNKRCEESKNNRNDNNGGSNSSSSSDVHSSTPSPSPASLSLPPPTPTSSSLSRNDLPTQLISANAAKRIKATTTTTTAAANKSYGYPEICTNACKCQVDVLLIQGDIHLRESNRKVKDVHEDTDIIATTLTTLTSPDSERSKWATNHHPISAIQIKNCDCNQLLAHKNQKNTERMKLNGMSVDKAYYKFLTTSGNRRKKDKCSATKPLTEETLVTASNGFPNMAKREPLKGGDLLDIAKQVAVGMEFLAKNKVVHRDLAARNVLVATDRTIKIADFGLSRDVYQENIYKKTGNGKLPIKWLALESMTHQVYTTQSDVWSYGILLYEIVTLGGTPYPAIPTNRLLHLLKSGYRMEKPKHCGQELYNLMYSCWNLNPAERPNFTQIIKTLEKLMGTAPENHIKSLLWSKAKRPQEASTDDAYLKPL